jgi:tetratricopeptide (TPR) repeat protein
MGDLTADHTWYEQAWTVSAHSYARAQRQLGHWCVKQGKFDAAIPHFDAALKLNPQYASIWFT